ncbi:ribosomal protein L13e [Candidatus Bathyarchaeota archaeon]|nr:ribosomal protein L13e [Candidatus Bathyarchaeota archaeon]
MKIQSVVQKRKDGTRKGKGFSRGELKEAKIDFKQALKLAIPLDLRRKTKHPENVKIIKEHMRKLGLKSKKRKKEVLPDKRRKHPRDQ